MYKKAYIFKDEKINGLHLDNENNDAFAKHSATDIILESGERCLFSLLTTFKVLCFIMNILIY